MLRYLKFDQVFGLQFVCFKLGLGFTVQNGTLREYLDNSTSLVVTEQIYFVHQLIFGLSYLHNHKIAHCDFKSLNVLLDAGYPE